LQSLIVSIALLLAKFLEDSIFDNIVDFVKKHAHDEDILTGITGYVHDFSKGMERADDLTIVEVKFI